MRIHGLDPILPTLPNFYGFMEISSYLGCYFFSQSKMKVSLVLDSEPLKKIFCSHILVLIAFSHYALVKFEVDCLAIYLREGNKGGEIWKDQKDLTFSIFQGTFSIHFDIIPCSENLQKLWDFL